MVKGPTTKAFSRTRGVETLKAAQLLKVHGEPHKNKAVSKHTSD